MLYEVEHEYAIIIEVEVEKSYSEQNRLKIIVYLLSYEVVDDQIKIDVIHAFERI